MSRRKRNKLKASRVTDEKKQSTRVADSFSNPLARMGFGMPNLLEATEYPLTRFTQNYQEINSLYRSHWVVQKIINVIPQDMLKNGYDIQSDLPPDQLQEVFRTIRKTRLHDKILEGLYWGRLYGGALGVMLIDGCEDLSHPLELDEIEIGDFKGLLILDRWNGVNVGIELVDDICDDEFGLPKYYEIQLNEGSAIQRVHHSRVCRFIGREMPYLEKMAENYWGTSELEHVIDELKKRDNVSWNIALLTFMANIRILKLEGMEQILSTGDERVQQRLYNTIEGMNQMLNSNALQVLGKDDDFVTQQYTFSGLGDVYDRFMMDVSGACGIPATKLFGRSPAGMNATGESDLQNYYDVIEANQESQLRPVLDKLLPVIFISALGAIPDDFDYIFNPVRRSQDVEKQNIGSQQTQAVVQAFTAGLISQKTALSELQGSSKLTGMWTNITDEEIANADSEVEAAGEAPMMPTMDADFNENDVKRDKNGKFATASSPKNTNKSSNSGSNKLTNQGTNAKVKVSKTGKNTMIKRDFYNQEVFDSHWAKHGAEYPGFSQSDYLERALNLVESECTPNGIRGYATAMNDIARYDPATNDFVKGHPVNGIKTLFKPKRKAAYYEDKRKEEGKL